MNISAVRLLLLFILIYSHAKPQHKEEGDPSTALPITNDTYAFANETAIIETTFADTNTRKSYEEDANHNIYEWKIIAVRVGIGGACAFAFVAFFAILYCCFNRGSSKKRTRSPTAKKRGQQLPVRGTSDEKVEVKRKSPDEGFESDHQVDYTPVTDESREHETVTRSTVSATSAHSGLGSKKASKE